MEIIKNYHNIFKTSSLSSFKNLCFKFKTELYKSSKSLNSIGSRLATMNTWIKNNLGPKYFNISKDILKLDKKDKQKQMKTQKDGYVEKLSNRIPIDVKIYMALIEKLKSSSNFIELVACFNLATGRRLIEIISQGDIKKIDNHWVEFKGQAKTKDKIKKYKIPIILLTSDELIELFKKIRSFKQKINVPYVSKEVSKLYKKYFRQDITSEMIRGAYVQISYHLYETSKVSLPIWGNMVLGHAKNDLATYTYNYDRIYLVNESKIFS